MTDPPGLLRRVARLFRPYRGRVAVVFVLIVVTSVLGVVNPLLTKAVFDKALFPPGQSGPNCTLLYELVAIMIVVPIVAAAIGVCQTYLTTVVGQRVMQDLRNRLYDAPAVDVAPVLHRHAHRRDPVAPAERRRRRPERGHQHRLVGALEHRSRCSAR